MLDLERPEHAYLLGFLLGDGHLQSSRGRKGRLSIEIAARDSDLLRALAPLLPGGLLSARTRATNFAVESRTVALSWCRLDVREAVVAAGMPVGRKDTLVAPPSVPCSQRDFARGFFDADGSIGFTARGTPFLSLVTRSPVMAAWWCELLLVRTGAQRSCRANARDGVANVMVQAEPAVALARWLYRPGDLALDRKRVIASQIDRWRRPPDMRAPSRPRRWTAADDARVVGPGSVLQIADDLGRTTKSVVARRWRLRRANDKGS